VAESTDVEVLGVGACGEDAALRLGASSDRHRKKSAFEPMFAPTWR